MLFFPPARSLRRCYAASFLALVAAVALSGSGCSSKSNSSNGGSTSVPTQQQTLTDIAALFQSARALVAQASAPTSSMIRRPRPEVTPIPISCSAGGTGSVTPSSGSYLVTYDACNDGTETYNGTFTVTPGATTTPSMGSSSETFTISGGPITETQASGSVTFDFPTPLSITVVITPTGVTETYSGTCVVGGDTTYTYDGESITYVPLDGGTAPTGDAGECGTAATGCSISVCPAGTSCTASGVSAMTYACPTAVAQYDDASGDTTITILNCLDEQATPQAGMSITGMPTVATYTEADPAAQGGGVICAGDLTGTYWAAGASAAEDGGALGSFTLTLTSVTPDTAVGAGVFFVHGTLSAQCAGGPPESGGSPPAGTVSMVVTF